MPRKVSGPTERIIYEAASMRPGLLCPGRGGRQTPSCLLAESFNEAGAVMPRKAGSGLAFVRSFGRFNEAGAVMPRKARSRRKGRAPKDELQ